MSWRGGPDGVDQAHDRIGDDEPAEPTREDLIRQLAEAHVRQNRAKEAAETARQEEESADQQVAVLRTALQKRGEDEVQAAMEALRG